jgi:hypothetical protein
MQSQISESTDETILGNFQNPKGQLFRGSEGINSQQPAPMS